MTEEEDIQNKIKPVIENVVGNTTPNKSLVNGFYLTFLIALLSISIPSYYFVVQDKQLCTAFTPSYGRIYKTHPGLKSSYFKHLSRVLDSLGYQNDQNSTQWDLLWSHPYPFTVLPELKSMNYHQKVNILPGSGYITEKVEFATTDIKYVPKAFKIPQDKEKLLKYVADNPTHKFVIKNNQHRSIKIQKVSDVDFDQLENVFMQKFIDNPLLIDGYMFDIGVYTIITSIEPLRVYIYNGDLLLRFCPEKYYPFNATNLDKYVVADDYRPIWDVPSLQYYFTKLGFGMRDSLYAYLKSKGHKPLKIQEQLEDAIRNIILSKANKIIDIVNRYPSKRNFFEMMRFDFLVDENLDVFAIEANMSPNLSSQHFKQNGLLYEQILFNVFRLIGVGDPIFKAFNNRTISDDLMVTADKNLAVMPTECSSLLCKESCMPETCHLCRPCLSPDFKLDLIQAHQEFLNKGDTKRIFPPKMDPTKKSYPEDFEDYTYDNKLMYNWFQEKCFLDDVWC